MIDLAVLGLLKEQELHGYELRKQVAELLGGRGAVSFGSLYPALARLERGGMVKAVEANEGPARPTPSSGSLAGELAAFRARRGLNGRGGRSRKVYGITERGEAHLVELLADPSPCDDRTFALRVAFCRFLAPEGRLALFERRRAEVTAQLATRHRRDTRLDHYLRSLREHDTASLEADLAWLDRLIAAERVEAEEGHH
jgi:DNA-binding PadR family transcriptional regulator